MTTAGPSRSYSCTAKAAAAIKVPDTVPNQQMPKPTDAERVDRLRTDACALNTNLANATVHIPRSRNHHRSTPSCIAKPEFTMWLARAHRRTVLIRRTVAQDAPPPSHV